MGNKAQQEPVVPESDLLKAIGDLEEAALAKGDTEPVPRGYMDSTRSARGGSVEVLEGGPGSRDGLVPDGHDDPSNFDMGSAQGSRAELGKAQSEDDNDKKGDKDDDMDKSMRKSLEQRPTIKKAIEVSQFLEELTDGVVDSVDGLRKSLVEGQQYQSQFNQRLAKAVVQLGETVESLQSQLADMGNQPVGRKSVLSKSELDARSFDGGAEGPDHHQFAGAEQVQKADVLDYLCDRAEKGEIPPETVTEFETSDVLPPNIAVEVRNHFGAVA